MENLLHPGINTTHVNVMNYICNVSHPGINTTHVNVMNYICNVLHPGINTTHVNVMNYICNVLHPGINTTHVNVMNYICNFRITFIYSMYCLCRCVVLCVAGVYMCTVLYCCQRVTTQLQLINIISYSNIYPTRCNVTQFILSGNCSTST